MSYDSSHRLDRRHNGFSVTTGKDGSRTFFGDHDDRWSSNTYRGSRGGSHGSRSTRGGRSSGFKHVNSRYSRGGSRYRALQDDDGDVSMGGDSRGRNSRRSRGGFSSRSRGQRGRGRGGSYRDSGASSHTSGNRSNEKWFRVTIPFGALMAKEDLFTLINDNIAGKFDPQKYSVDDNKRAYFFVEGSEQADNLRSLSRRVDKPDGHKMIILAAPSQPPDGTIGPEALEKLTLRMSGRYDPSTQLLNLSNLQADEELTKEKLFFPLNRPSTVEFVTKIIGEHIPELTGLDLSNNRIGRLDYMVRFVKAATGVTSLNLGQNFLKSLDEVEKLKGWTNVTELMLDGNDLCNNYSNKDMYVSAVRKIFPKVVTLDGNPLPPPITFDLDTEQLQLPPSVDCYFVNDEIKGTLVTFIKEYFTIYDSNSRKNLMAAYHENAQFSYCTSRNPCIDKQPGFHLWIEDSRNLKKIGHYESDKLIKKTKLGQLSVIAFLETLPKSLHDLTSFKVDVTLALPSMLSFLVSGAFKETDANSKRPIIRGFSRSFLIVPLGSGMVITNDMLTVTNLSFDQTKNLFKDAPSQPSSSTPATAASTSTQPTASAQGGLTPERVQMVESFVTQSGMNAEFSMRCLEENGWDYQKAGTIFLQLKNDGKIPPEAFVKAPV